MLKTGGGCIFFKRHLKLFGSRTQSIEENLKCEPTVFWRLHHQDLLQLVRHGFCVSSLSCSLAGLQRCYTSIKISNPWQLSRSASNSAQWTHMSPARINLELQLKFYHNIWALWLFASIPLHAWCLLWGCKYTAITLVNIWSQMLWNIFHSCLKFVLPATVRGGFDPLFTTMRVLHMCNQAEWHTSSNLF